MILPKGTIVTHRVTKIRGKIVEYINLGYSVCWDGLPVGLHHNPDLLQKEAQDPNEILKEVL